MGKEPSMSATKISAFLRNIERYGLDRDGVLRGAGIPPSSIASPDQRVPSSGVHRIFLSAARLTRNNNIGLVQGEGLTKGFSTILGHLLMNCRSLGEAIEKFCQYEKTVDETSHAALRRRGALVEFSNTSTEHLLTTNRQLSDFKIAGSFSYMGLLAGKEIVLSEVFFTHPAPEDIFEYRRIFKCPVHFGRPVNALVFDRQVLDLPLIEPNAGLLPLLENNAREALHAVEGSDTYARKVSGILLQEMKGKVPTIVNIAEKLGMGVRSLQGHLKKEGVSFSKLREQVRRETAKVYLKDKNSSIEEIAFILGFSEPSAFHRAFRKWTNRTPGRFRTE